VVIAGRAAVPAPNSIFPLVFAVIAVVAPLLPTFRAMLSDVPTPDVDLSVSVDDTALPPTTVGALTVVILPVVAATVVAVAVVNVPAAAVVPPIATLLMVPPPFIEPVSVSVPATASVLPEPTFNPTEVPVPAAANRASTVSQSALVFVPHVSRDAPTSGFVRLRFAV